MMLFSEERNALSFCVANGSNDLKCSERANMTRRRRYLFLYVSPISGQEAGGETNM